jgi:murein DD-endopeptidase MepM/ murein hydrolase activator NlpD
MARSVRSLSDFALAALCLWAAWYHTPPGALLRSGIAFVFHTRSPARPVLSYYGSGAQAAPLRRDIPIPRVPLDPGAALGLGAWSALQEASSGERGRILASAGVDATPDSIAAHLAHSRLPREAAVLEFFCGAEPARFALERARAEGETADLEDLARQLPPRYADRVSMAAQALAMGTAYGLAWPLPDWARVTSPFGLRAHPMLGGRRMHAGVDLGVPIGTPVHAAAAGLVRRASRDAANGLVVLIDHGSGVSTLYCHNDELLVSAGDSVEKGQIISRSGNTGRSTGPHLHYQLDLPSGPVDPLRFRSGKPEHAALDATEP